MKSLNYNIAEYLINILPNLNDEIINVIIEYVELIVITCGEYDFSVTLRKYFLKL